MNEKQRTKTKTKENKGHRTRNKGQGTLEPGAAALPGSSGSEDSTDLNILSKAIDVPGQDIILKTLT